MPAPRWLLPFVGTLALATCSSTVLAAEASRDQSEWPCVQHKVDRLSSAQMWDGPPVEDLTGWREDKSIQKLVPVLTSRRVPIDDARKAIDDFAQSLPEEQRDQKLKLLFAAVLDATNRDRAVVMAGRAPNIVTCAPLKTCPPPKSLKRSRPTIGLCAYSQKGNKRFRWRAKCPFLLNSGSSP